VQHLPGPASLLTAAAAPGRNLDLNTPVERIDLHGQKVSEARDMLVDLLGPHIKYRHKRECLCPVTPARHNRSSYRNLAKSMHLLLLRQQEHIDSLQCLHDLTD
jgi:DNA-nicking Smr family endonuclease